MGAEQRNEALERFTEIYAGGQPPWDLGRPRDFVLALHEAGWLGGDVLDLGCGTGENALALAERGCRVVGIDFVPAAIEAARRKAQARGVEARFVLGDVLEIDLGPERFDAALDVGLFHVFDDAQRARYVQRLRRWLRPGGRLALSCFSDREPGEDGPRRIREAELREAFADGWRIEAIEPRREPSRGGERTVETWLLRAVRLED